MIGDKTARESLEELRRTKSVEMELALSDFQELTEAEQKEFLVLALFRFGEWINWLRSIQRV